MVIVENESSFDAEFYRLNKLRTTRLWALPALQYFRARGSFPGSPCVMGAGLTPLRQLLGSGH